MTKKIYAPVLLVCGAVFGLSMAPAAQADVATLVKSCDGCHGSGGASTHDNVPVIGGVSSAYLADMLNQYKSGDRKNCEEVKDDSGAMNDMCKVAKDLSDDDTKALADHYAGKKFAHAKQGTDAALAAKGKAIAGDACEKCHTEGGSVAGDDSGVLLGQWKGYLKKEMADFQAGKRNAPKKMSAKLEKLEAADVDALVEYYAGGQK